VHSYLPIFFSICQTLVPACFVSTDRLPVVNDLCNLLNQGFYKTPCFIILLKSFLVAESNVKFHHRVVSINQGTIRHPLSILHMLKYILI